MGVPAVVQTPGTLERCGEWIASRSAGQLLVRGVDSVLRLIEKSLMWSTQTAQRPAAASDAGVEDPDCRLVVVSRPLAWPLFLPLLGVLGVVRVTFYYVTRVFRKPQDTTDLIHWLQSKRRSLHAVQFAGLKKMRQREGTDRSDRTPNGTPCTKAKIISSITPEHERKRKYEDVEQSDFTDCSDDESAAVKLEKYTHDYDSESDPDFVPEVDESTDDSDASEDDIEEEGAFLVSGIPDVPVPPSITGVPVSPSIVNVESPQSPNLQAALEVV